MATAPPVSATEAPIAATAMTARLNFRIFASKGLTTSDEGVAGIRTGLNGH
jgi:hypothetical protein